MRVIRVEVMRAIEGDEGDEEGLGVANLWK